MFSPGVTVVLCRQHGGGLWVFPTGYGREMIFRRSDIGRLDNARPDVAQFDIARFDIAR